MIEAHRLNRWASFLAVVLCGWARYLAAMRNTRLLTIIGLIALLLSGCQGAQTPRTLAAVNEQATPAPTRWVTANPRAAAVAVLASFDEGQRTKATRPIDAPLRKDWHFIPREREGLGLGEMSVEQKTAVHTLMHTALSDAGYLKATDIIWLETVLAEMEKRPEFRDPGNYKLVIFGDPADENAAWGWRLEGHHLSLNMTYTAEGVGVTPMFFGNNPAVVPIGPLAGKRILADEHSLAVELAKSMSDEQRAKMVLEGKPKDIITSPGHESSLEKAVGIAVQDLSARQQDELLELVFTHLNNLESHHAASLYKRVVNLYGDAPVLEGFSFAWAGPIDADQPFYYRIHSPKFVIEFCCQGRNHVHCVIHDLSDPLQEDLLKKHFEQHEH